MKNDDKKRMRIDKKYLKERKKDLTMLRILVTLLLKNQTIQKMLRMFLTFV